MERVFVHKHCLECGEEYVPNSATQKYCSTCAPRAKRQRHEVWRVANRDKYHAMNTVWSKEHPEKRCAQSKRWRNAHPEKAKENWAVWQAAHPDYGSVYSRNHREEMRADCSRWRTNHPDIIRFQNFKRRTLGFIPLNSPFLGCEAHHINKNDIIYIPKVLHHSVPHNVWTGRGMDKINTLAGQYLTEDWT